MSTERVRIAVAGIPLGYQRPLPDGRWLTAEHRAQIEAVSPRVELVHTSRAALEAGEVPAPGAEVLFIQLGGEQPSPRLSPGCLRALVTPRLRWVQSCSAGNEQILRLGVLTDAVVLTSALGAHANALAESVLAAILLHAKRLVDRLDRQRERRWEPLHCAELRDKTVCVIGTGHIGTAVARLAGAFRMRVVGVRRTPRPAQGFATVVGPGALLTLLPEADYVVVACPLTPETEGLLGPAEFAAMKPGAYLISISRGRVVREPALLDALAGGRLDGAFLDVHAQEPLPPDHPLWAMPGVTVIPHDSHSSQYTGDNLIALFCDNLRRYLAGRPLRNVVDRARGY